MDIHGSIKHKLNSFYENKKIPNIIFHGLSGCGKSTIAYEFLKKIYGKEIDGNVMFVNCSYGKGIKFIRENLKFFAKTNVIGETSFKTILLYNADKLTVDAQSALRRCIELFMNTTRFFIIIEDQNKLMNPIVSRFCSIYIPLPNNENLHTCNVNNHFPLKEYKKNRYDNLIKLLKNKKDIDSSLKLIDLTNDLYNKGYSSFDLIQLIDSKLSVLSKEDTIKLMFGFDRIRKDVRNENIMMFFLLKSIFVGLDHSINNIPSI